MAILYEVLGRPRSSASVQYELPVGCCYFFIAVKGS